MLRFVMRYGLVRLIGRRAVPALIVWDVAVLANRTRQIPIVDRVLRRSVGTARQGIDSVVRRAPRPARPSRPGSRRPDPDA